MALLARICFRSEESAEGDGDFKVEGVFRDVKNCISEEGAQLRQTGTSSSYRTGGARYQDTGAIYSTPQPGQSSASLISSNFRESGDTTDSTRDDDEAHLTANMSRQGAGGEWGIGHSVDPERSGASPRSARRRTVRYSTSPLKKTGTTIMSVSRNLRRASLRVVNFGGYGLEDHVRLDDVDERDVKNRDEDEIPDEDEVLPDLSRALPIRGRTLGCLGPRSKVRLAMYKFLTYP